MRWNEVPEYRQRDYHYFDNLPKVVRQAIANADYLCPPVVAQKMLWSGDPPEVVATRILQVYKAPDKPDES